MQSIEATNTELSEAPNTELSVAERRLTANLAFASRMLSAGGHDDFNQGQVSSRIPGRDRFLIKSAQRGFDEAVPEDMIAAEVDHCVPPNPIAPPELPLHQAIYAARPDVNAIVHSHAPNSLVFGALDVDVAPISHEGSFFSDSCPRFTLTSNTVLDITVGAQIADALGAASAVFLRNHGIVVVGKTIKHAAVGAQILERACMLQLKVMATGLPFHVSSADDVDRKREYIYSSTAIKSYWDYSVRRVVATWPHVAQWSQIR